MTISSKPLLSLQAGDVMSRNVILIPREMSLQGAARLLARAGVSGAPVVDARGICIGVISTTDFMHWVQGEHSQSNEASGSDCMCKAWQIPEGALPTCNVGDFMTRDPVLVDIEAKIGDIAHMMIDAHIHRVIVVDHSGNRPLGVVSSMDILAAVARAEQAESAISDQADQYAHETTNVCVPTST
jgi:CBS domain-containing protein